MKVLHTVEQYTPSVGGSQEVVRQISEHLVSLGHDVTVATSYNHERVQSVINGVKIHSFNVRGNSVIGMSGELKKYRDFILKSKFDIILNYAAQTWTTDALTDIIQNVHAKKIFIPCGFSGLKHPAFHEYYKKVPEWINKYNAVVFTSDTYIDYAYLRGKISCKTIVIPNGANETEFANITPDYLFKSRYQIPESNKVILNISSHVYSKNHKGAITIFKKAKIKSATLVIIGNSFDDKECTQQCFQVAKSFNQSFMRRFDKKQIIILDVSRTEVLKAYKSSDIFLFPSQIECAPLVLYECLASGLPFIVYKVGNSVEIAKKSQAGVIVENEKSASQVLRQLIENTTERKRMRSAGRTIWRKKYKWDFITKKYENLYKEMVQES